MRLIFVLSLSLFLQSIAAQQLIIKDIQTKEPLAFVTVVARHNNLTTSSNEKGEINLEGFKNTDTLQFRLLGYKTVVLPKTHFKEDKAVFFLEPSIFQLDPIVISASRWRQNSNEVSSKISSISKKDVHFQNPQTAADLLGTSGDVLIQKSQQGGGSPIIRGFSSNRLLYSVDGVRMNTAIFRSGNLQNVISLDPFAIQQTEVLFGPGSVIYGSDAIGGVMSFTTLEAQLDDSKTFFVRGNVASRYATANDERTIHADVNFGWDQWSFLTSLSQVDYGDLRMGAFGPKEYERDFLVQRRDGTDEVLNNSNRNVQLPSAYSQLNFMQKIRFKPSRNVDLVYGFHLSESTNFDRYDRLLQIREGLPRYSEWYYGPQKWNMHHLTMNYSAKKKIFDQFKASLAYQHFEESRINRDLNDTLRLNRKEKVDAFSLNLDFTKKIKENNQLYYGIETVMNAVNSGGELENINSGFKTRAQSRYPNSDWYSYAFYATDQYTLNEKWILNSGIRFSGYSLRSKFDTTLFALPFTSASIDNAALNGSIGLVYKSNEKLIFSSNISTGYRAPNVDDIGKIFDSEPGAIVVPNADLKAEFAYNFDLGIAKVFGDRLKVDITAFYTLLENALVRRNFTLNGQDSILYEGEFSQVQAIQNAAEAYVYGLQLGLEIKINKYFDFNSQLNYQRGEEELDDGSTSPSRHAAPTFGVSRLNFRKGKFRAQFYVEYSDAVMYKDLNVGERAKTHIYAIDDKGNPYSPAWHTFNIKTQYMHNSTLSFTLGLENISDQRYKTYSSGIAAAGRNFQFGVRANF